MTVLELQQIDALNDFETAWNKLLFRSLDNRPFLTYEWLSIWWKHFGKGRELKLFTAENKGAVSLALPLMYSAKRIFGSRRCEASLMGVPDSDYQVFIVTNFQEAARAINPLIETILEDSGTDRLAFSDVPEDSVTARLLAGVKGESFGVDHSVINSCPYVCLPNNHEEFLYNLGSNMRRNLKIWERNALKDYKVEFISQQKIGTLKEAMRVFFELHQKSQTAKGHNGVFSSNTYRNFHLDLANTFANRGWLALFFLTFNDEPVSTIYSFEYNGKLYAYLCGFDPEYAGYRPGHLAFKKLMEYGIKKNLKELDFLRGDEEYKTRWRPTIRKNLEFQLNKKGLKSRFYNWNTDSRYFSNLNQKVNSLARTLSKNGM